MNITPRTLYPHQETAMELLRQSARSGKKRIVVHAPTGFGKTVLAAHISKGVLARGERIVFTAPRISLIDQTVTSFYNEGITDIGVMQANHPLTNIGMPLQVCSIDTLSKRLLPPPTPWVLIDECHLWRKFYAEWMALPEWQNTRFIGLSATPWTKGLGKYYDDLVIAATTAEMIQAGHLSDYRAFGPTRPDLSAVKTVTNAQGERDYHEGELAERMSDKLIVADVVSTWKEKAEERQTLCFAVNRAHARLLEDKFKAAGIPTGYVDGLTPPNEREQIRRQFHNGELQVVVSIGCLTTGVDWDVRCISLCRPTKSKILYVQMIGRGLRKAEGKDYCLVLDHTNTIRERLGFVEHIHQDELDDGTPKRSSKREVDKEPLPKDCPSCGALKKPALRKCPQCGFEAKPHCDVAHADGELAELRREQIKFGRDTAQRWYSELLGIADERGYKQGWVAHTYRKKFGDWPRDLAEIPITPSPQVKGYVKHLLIAHAKRQPSMEAA